MKTDTQTLIDALRVLSRDIHCEDGVATATIAEAADRLEELRLTDEERAAVADAADRYAALTPESCETAATLRGLLERLS